MGGFGSRQTNGDIGFPARKAQKTATRDEVDFDLWILFVKLAKAGAQDKNTKAFGDTNPDGPAGTLAMWRLLGLASKASPCWVR